MVSKFYPHFLLSDTIYCIQSKFENSFDFPLTMNSAFLSKFTICWKKITQIRQKQLGRLHVTVHLSFDVNMKSKSLSLPSFSFSFAETNGMKYFS